MLEDLERYTVALNLGMIGALLVALAIHNARLWAEGTWKLPDVATGVDFHGIRVLLGLLIVVQGFETSRYLGGRAFAGRPCGHYAVRAAPFDGDLPVIRGAGDRSFPL